MTAPVRPLSEAEKVAKIAAFGFDRVETLCPEDYAGQTLCECCGNDGTGHRYMICAEGVPHEGSCSLYHYEGLCGPCDETLTAEHEAEILEGGLGRG